MSPQAFPISGRHLRLLDQVLRESSELMQLDGATTAQVAGLRREIELALTALYPSGGPGMKAVDMQLETSIPWRENDRHTIQASLTAALESMDEWDFHARIGDFPTEARTLLGRLRGRR